MERIPKFMSIHDTAKTGILPEHCLRVMARRGELPAIKSGNKVLINVDKLVEMMNSLGEGKNEPNKSN